MSDWIESFIEATGGTRTAESFRLWAAIGTLASALERKIWTETDVDRLYPNLYTVLAGLPASGKTNMIRESRKMLVSITDIKLGPDAPTPASFMDALENSGKASINGSGNIYVSAMTVLCEEFGVLIPKYNENFLASLSKLYDNGPMHTEPRRTSKSTSIENPTVNILAAATPAALGNFPDAAWGEGFTSRVIFAYGVAPTAYRSVFKKRSAVNLTMLQKRLNEIFYEIHGEMIWEDEAQSAFEHWYNVEKMAPIPTYGRLVNYNGRRDLHVMKLTMISAISAGHGLTVTLSDFLRGREWLLEAEKTMPDVFRAITMKSDAQLIQDLHHHLYRIYSKVAREKRIAIPEHEIWRFLETRTTSDKIPRIISAAESAGRIRRGLMDKSWLPNTIDETYIGDSQ